MLYIYLDFAENQDHKMLKTMAMEKLSEKNSFSDYGNIFNSRTIKKLFNAIADVYAHEKSAFGLDSEKLVCKCIETNSGELIHSREIN